MKAEEAFEILREELRGAVSPWKSRSQAAAYLGCTEHWIDDMVSCGLLIKRYLANSPRFHRDDLDKLVTTEKVNVRGMRQQQREEQTA